MKKKGKLIYGTINMEKMNQWSLKGYVVVNNTPPEQLERVKINQCISENQEWKGR